MRRILTFSGIVLVIALIDCHQEPEIIGTYLAVSSTPQGADVYIDDSLTEYQTNCVIPDIEPGEYTIKLLHSTLKCNIKVSDFEGCFKAQALLGSIV